MLRKLFKSYLDVLSVDPVCKKGPPFYTAYIGRTGKDALACPDSTSFFVPTQGGLDEMIN